MNNKLRYSNPTLQDIIEQLTDPTQNTEITKTLVSKADYDRMAEHGFDMSGYDWFRGMPDIAVIF